MIYLYISHILQNGHYGIICGIHGTRERIAQESMLTLFMTISGTCQVNKKNRRPYKMIYIYMYLDTIYI